MFYAQYLLAYINYKVSGSYRVTGDIQGH